MKEWVVLFVQLCILVLVVVLPFNLGIFVALVIVAWLLAAWAIRRLIIIGRSPSGKTKEEDTISE